MYAPFKIKENEITFEQIINLDYANYDFEIIEFDPEIIDNLENFVKRDDMFE